LQLFKQYASYAIRYFEPAVVSFDKVEKKPVCREVTFFRDFSAYSSIFRVIEVVVVRIENGVMAQPERLMNLKIETYRSHNQLTFAT
jgi:hypothetical protein